MRWCLRAVLLVEDFRLAMTSNIRLAWTESRRPALVASLELAGLQLVICAEAVVFCGRHLKPSVQDMSVLCVCRRGPWTSSRA